MVSKDDPENLLPPTLFATGILDDDPDRLMWTKHELMKIQGQMEEFVNGMMKYRVDSLQNITCGLQETEDFDEK